MNKFWDIIIGGIVELDRPSSVAEIGSEEGRDTKNLLECINRLKKAITEEKETFELRLKEAENDQERLWGLLDNKNAETGVLEQRLAQAEGEQDRLRGILRKKTADAFALEQTNQTLEQKLKEAEDEQERLKVLIGQNAAVLEQTKKGLEQKLKEAEGQQMTQLGLLEQKSAEAAALVQTKQNLEQAQHTLEAANKEAAQENELLLLQLHQVQEELEAVFLQKQQLEKTRGDLRTALDKKTAEAAKLMKKLTEVESRQEQLRGMIGKKDDKISGLITAKKVLQKDKAELAASEDKLRHDLALLSDGLSNQVASAKQALFTEETAARGLHVRSSGSLTPVRQLFSMAAAVAESDRALGIDRRRIYKKSFARWRKHGVLGVVDRLENEYLKVRPNPEDGRGIITPGIRKKLMLRTLDEMQGHLDRVMEIATKKPVVENTEELITNPASENGGDTDAE